MGLDFCLTNNPSFTIIDPSPESLYEQDQSKSPFAAAGLYVLQHQLGMRSISCGLRFKECDGGVFSRKSSH